ncbi:Nramp family divalent metal transporter [Schlesneria paludicola]|uniref:Nramp family divalent metal transporter n=1 Tax=Schlesneria paludicola TaxID=360056 RepID=UPI00029AB87C|nr:Nramp family divalent metal transporter [Schlesneria paludicola]
MNAETSSVDSSETINPGCLPAWDRADLPEPLPFGFFNLFKTIGPGAILLVAAIGGGEWIAGPMATIKFGRGILWIATLAVVLQTIFNLEAARYTMYTGEPILTGFMRLKPGSLFWAWFYILIGVAQLATPALAAGCGAVLYAAFLGHLPQNADQQATQHWIATGVIIFAVALLLSGKSIERVLERLSWIMIVFIFGFLIIVNVLFVPREESLRSALGFIGMQPTHGNLDLVLLATFAATAGSGGLGNLAISNWFRDKGFAMGSLSGSIGNALAGEESAVRAIGTTFPTTPENMRRWHTWWRYAVLDQVALWAFGCVIGMYLNVNLAAYLIPPDVELKGMAAGTFQAQYMSEKMWSGFWYLALLNGFWILFSTHLGNTDVLVRLVSDISWVAFPKIRRWPVSRLYAVLLVLLTTWAVFAVRWGSVLELFEILGVVACPIMAIASLQILRVNTTFLPPAVRPKLWRRIGLVLCSLAYGGFTIALLIKRFGG